MIMKISIRMSMTMMRKMMMLMMTTMMGTMVAGEVDTSVDQLLSLKPSAQLPLVNPRKKGKQPRYKVFNFHDDTDVVDKI